MTEIHRRKHRSGHRKTRSGTGNVEKNLTKHFFRILGIAFFIAGAVFLARQMKPGDSLLNSIISFLTSAGPEETAGNMIFSNNGWNVFLQLLPGFLMLTIPFFLYSRSPAFARISAFTGVIWVFAVHIKVLSIDYLSGFSYPTLFAAMIVTLALCVLPLWHAFKLKQYSLQMMTILLFYISFLLLLNDYQWHYYIDFLCLFIFSLSIIFLGFKTGKLVPFYFQALLSILLVSVFWIRRMVLRDSADLVSTYIIISSLFYAVFFISGFSFNLSKKNVVHELMATLLMVVNTLFYWGSVLFVLQKYGYADLQGLFTLVLALFSGTLIYFSSRLNPDLFRNPYIFTVLFLFSMVLPLWAQQNYVILGTSLFSVLLIFFAKYATNRPALLSSMGLVAIMSAMFFYKWVRMYFPGLYAGFLPADLTLFYNGFQAGFFTLFALFFNYQNIKSLEKTVTGSWVSRRKYRLILKILFLTVLYMTGFWCWHFLFTLLIPFGEAMVLSWFSFTSLFLLILVPVLIYRNSSLLRPVFVATAFTLLSYPLLVNFSIAAIRNMALISGGVYSSTFIAHYFLLPVILGLILCLYYPLKKTWAKQNFMIRLLRIFITGLVLSVVLLEYDHFTIFFGYAGQGQIPEMVSYNHHLPWSVILLIFSLSLIVFGVIRKQRFIPQLAVVLLLATVAKILVYDFALLGDSGKIIVLFILGAFMIAFSFFYQRFRKMMKERESK